MTDNVFILSSGEEIPVFVTTRRGIKNITLRPKTIPTREIHISKPWLTPTGAALRFAERKRRWIETIFARAPTRIHIAPGDTLEFLGRTVKLEHNPGQHSNCYRADGAVLVIGGAPDMFERRLRELIKKEFVAAVKSIIKTVPRDFWPKRISVRDTTTRWGSCSTSGTMSFSWRLAFAPYDVMRYVVMHELAHQKHMDHSPAFWAMVATLYGDGVGRAKRWLKINGGQLHMYL